MAINPLLINTARVGELPIVPFSLTDKMPHEVGTDLSQGTLQDMADTIGGYLGAFSGLAFNPTVVNDGGTLPDTLSPEWMLIGAGTFYNVGGGSNIVATEVLNALTSNGIYWSLAVEIPINVSLAGITQNIRSGYTSTTPSEGAVFKALQDLTALIPSSFPKVQFTSDGVQNTYSLITPILAKAIFWNGALLNDIDWTHDGSTLSLTFTPASGDLIKPI